MKKFKNLFFALILIPVLFVFSACNKTKTDSRTDLKDCLVSLEQTTYIYDNVAKRPDVTVKYGTNTIDASNYTVAYINNINIGTATVKVKAKDDSKVLKGEVSKTFEITDGRVQLETSHIRAIPAQEYDGTAKTPEIEVVVGNNTIAPSNYSIDYSNNIDVGTATVTVTASTTSLLLLGSATRTFEIVPKVQEVASAADFAEHVLAAEDDSIKQYIKLTDNLAPESQINLTFTANARVEIDLNGKQITNRLRIDSANHNVELSIKNGKIGADNIDYAITLFGNNLDLELDGVEVTAKLIALSTNGLATAENISATACKFTAQSNVSGDTTSGVYLPAGGTFVFETCEITGDTGVFAKNGEITLSNCTITGEKEPSANQSSSTSGFNATGSAVVIENNSAYNNGAANIEINGGKLVSKKGYAVEEYKVGDPTAHSTITLNEIEISCDTTMSALISVSNTALLAGKETCTAVASTAKQVNELIKADTVKNIKLLADIEATNETTKIEFVSSASALQEKVLDLNTHTIKLPIRIANSLESELKVSLKNGNVLVETPFQAQTIYGVLLYGNNITLSLNTVNVTATTTALITNGLFDENNITATNCKFLATGTHNVEAGAYLPAGGESIFTNCSFTGATGIFLKAGNVALENCTIIGNGSKQEPSPSTTGFNPTGSAIVIETNNSYHLPVTLTINGGTIASINNFSFEEYRSQDVADDVKATVNIDGATYYTGVTSSDDNVTRLYVSYDSNKINFTDTNCTQMQVDYAQN